MSEDLSMRDSISSAYDAVERGETAPAAPDPAGEAAPPTGASSSPDNAASAPPDPAAKAPDAATDPSATPAPAPDAPKMPPGFPGGEAAWTAVPAETKTWLKAREAHIGKFVQQNAEAAKFGASIYQALRPYEHMIRASGAHPAQIVAEAMNLNYTLTQGSQAEKAAAIQRMAQHAGLDLSSVAHQPEGAQVSPEVAELRETVRALVGHLRGQEQQQTHAQLQQAVMTVEEFAKDPARKYMADPDVRERMAKLLETGYSQTIEHAYDNAIWTRHDIRTALRAEDAASRTAQARAAVAEAPPRGGAPVAAVMAPDNESLRATIERAYDASSRRAA